MQLSAMQSRGFRNTLDGTVGNAEIAARQTVAQP
jgi:hypothetical protein